MDAEIAQLKLRILDVVQEVLKISQDIYSSVVHLLDKYKDINMPPVDYLQLLERESLIQEDEYESVVEIFLSVVQHRQFLTDVTNYFYCLVKRRDYSDRNSLIVFIYLLIFVLSIANKDEITNILQEVHLEKVINFLKLFNRKSIVEDLFLAGCQYFEENYVLEKIVSKMRENKDLLQDMLCHFEEILDRQREECRREVTTTVSPRVSLSLHSCFPPPPPPANTPTRLSSIKPVPTSTYSEPKESITLTIIKALHRRTNLELLEQANKTASHLSAAKRKPHACNFSTDAPKPTPHLRILKSDVPVKKNATTVLREASRVIKEEEKEIQRVKELVCGAANYMRYEELLEQVRACEEQARLEDIERKHLRGLLTREEAILARQNLLEANKEKRAQIDLEKKETEEMLRQMRQKDEEKLKDMIEKTHQIKKNIVEKKQNMINERQKKAQEMTETIKHLYEEALIRQREEMEKRISIIKEIKALSSIKELHGEKFDPTETMNLGLLCEMSLTELQERLLVNKVNLEEEIEKRQMCIRKQRLKQQQFLADTEQFIEACRMQKKIVNNIAEEKQQKLCTKKESQDIIDLREKLQKARQKRMELKKNE